MMELRPDVPRFPSPKVTLPNPRLLLMLFTPWLANDLGGDWSGKDSVIVSCEGSSHADDVGVNLDNSLADPVRSQQPTASALSKLLGLKRRRGEHPSPKSPADLRQTHDSEKPG